jgi:ABC-type nitrate/sulfonate/bicarbonate transport system substrate-binding protein
MKTRLCRILITALLCGLTVLTPVFAGGGKEKPVTGSGKKTVVADANSTHHLDLYVAYEKGLFSNRGLDVDIQQANLVLTCQTIYALIHSIHI